MASSDYALDGGFSPNSYNINLRPVPGVLYATGPETFNSTTLSSPFIASAEDSQATTSYNRLFVDGSANYYTWDGTTLTKAKTGTATSHYTFGKTDMASFNNETYVTLDDDVALWNTSSGTLTESWWVSTKSKTGLNSSLPHPMLVYNNVLWIADGNTLHNVDSGAIDTTYDALTLNAGELIYALGIDPLTGLMLMSVQMTIDYQNDLSSRYFIYMYDGVSTKPRRIIPVEDLITAFYNVGGVTYVGYGQNLGQLAPYSGGIQFLRKLGNTTVVGTDLLYKHHFANIGETLYFVDGQNVVAYGPTIQKGPPVFYNLYQQNAAFHIGLIANAGHNTLALSYPTASNNVFSTIDVTSTSAGASLFYSQKINFPRKVWVRLVRIVTTGIATTNSSGIGGVALIDDTQHIFTPATQTFVNTASASQYVFEFPFSRELQTCQLRISQGTQGFGIVRVIIFYDAAE